MKISDFKWMTKRNGIDRTENAGRQIVLDYGIYHLSIIDDGYGREQELYEIGVFSASDGVANDMKELPGITSTGDSVKGYLSLDEVNCILKKMMAITGCTPKQI